MLAFDLYMQDYFNAAAFILVAFVLVLILFLVSSFFNAREYSYNLEKLSVYECGFDPFGVIRKKFDIKYYIVAILFIIFDLEIVLLLPWVFVYSWADSSIFWILWFFLVVLIIGFIYEWGAGALEWQ